VELRLDPNGRWSIDEARRRLERLAPLAPAFVEQSVRPGDLVRLGPCAVPWAADESLGLAGVAEELSQDTGCGAFVIKPAALGVLRSRELAAIAHGDPYVDRVSKEDGPDALVAAVMRAHRRGPAR